MIISFDEVDGFTKVALAGRLDTAGVSLIEVQFSAGVAPPGTMVDMSEVEFLASLGVRMLISAARVLSSRGARLVMFGAQPVVAETVEVMGFDDIVPLASSQAEALELLRA